MSWEESIHPQDVFDLRTSEICLMSLQQFDEAFAKNAQFVKAQYEDIELQIEKQIGFGKLINSAVYDLQALVPRKIAIL